MSNGGTIPCLFTDIEGSTKLWEEHPDAMRQAVMRHEELAQEIVRRHNGRILKSKLEGDSILDRKSTRLNSSH